MKLALERLLFCMNVRGTKYGDAYITKLYTIILEDFCVLNAQEEKEIVRCCQVLGEIGVCADRNVVGTVVRDYLQALGRSSPFEDGVPGRRWWQKFFKRWPELSLKGYWNI